MAAVPRYAYDQSFAEERERLAGIERLWDPGTRALLTRLGIAAGWRCLEVGGGGGSIARWMAERVGPSGSVLATDVYTKFLATLELPNLEVREHDILADEPLPAEFDLVYARLLVEHLGAGALRALAAAARPGGIVVVEDLDWAAATTHPPLEVFTKVADAVLGLMAEAGFDANFGRRLPLELDAAGLEEVEAEGRVRVIRGGSPETAFFRLSLGSLRSTLVERGLVTEEEIERALATDDPANVYLTPILVSAWGRRPA